MFRGAAPFAEFQKPHFSPLTLLALLCMPVHGLIFSVSATGVGGKRACRVVVFFLSAQLPAWILPTQRFILGNLNIVAVAVQFISHDCPSFAFLVGARFQLFRLPLAVHVAAPVLTFMLVISLEREQS